MKALEMVPKDMSSAYHDVLGRIEASRAGDKDLALNILSWLFRAGRTMRMDELTEALAMEDMEVDEEDIHAETMAPSEIVECCKSLVEYDQDTGLVRFTHYTVSEFIESQIRQQLPPPLSTAKSCMNCLTFCVTDRASSTDDTVETAKKYKFCVYAAEFWGLHVRGEPEEDLKIQRDVLCLGSQRTTLEALLRMESYADIRCTMFTEGQTDLHVLTRMGLETIFRICLDQR
jgi:hypothetical protein